MPGRSQGGVNEGRIVVGRRVGCAAVLAVALLAAGSGHAADQALPWPNEVRLGSTSDFSSLSPNLELQVLSSPLPSLDVAYDPNIAWLFTPRLMVGGTVNFQGRTDEAYAGLAWTVPIRGPFFLEFSEGGLVHNQKLNVTYTDRPSPLTTRFLFRESAALGIEINPTWRVLAMLDHGSDGDLGYRNIGVNRFGVLLGGKFGPTAAAVAPASPPAAAAPGVASFNWTGPYVGASAGVARANIDFANPPGTDDRYDSVNVAVQGGFNWALGPLVMGLETDYSVQNLNGSAPVNPGAGIPAVSADSFWLVTGRGRIGADIQMPFLPNRFLVYGTGGAALTRMANSYCASPCYKNHADLANIIGGWLVQSDLRLGWTAGVGIELPLAPAVSAKFEYLYVDFGKIDFTNPVITNEQFTFTQQIIRAGMNIKLN